MRIKEFELKEETVVEIGKFAILWNLFEHDYCDNHCNPKKIIEKVSEIYVDDKAQMELSWVLNERRNWSAQLEMDYVRESLHHESSKKSSEEEMQMMCNFLKWEGDNMLCGCLLVIHRIRNNLMHGIKNAEELDDQIDLFKAANNVLENIRWKI